MECGTFRAELNIYRCCGGSDFGGDGDTKLGGSDLLDLKDIEKKPEELGPACPIGQCTRAALVLGWCMVAAAGG